MKIKELIDSSFKSFNARELRDAARAWRDHKGKMMVTLGGAMSTAQIGIPLARLIRSGKVHAVCCTGANLEEDFYNAIGAQSPLPSYRDLTPEQEEYIRISDKSRVTDMLIDNAKMRKVDLALLKLWKDTAGPLFPHEYFYSLFDSGIFKFQWIENSWLYACYQHSIPVFVPGWEDSSSGNYFTSRVISGEVDRSVVKGGVEYFEALAKWYIESCGFGGIGFFQIGGGIAGDFAICVVPMLEDDLKLSTTPPWSYFCQISDSTTSYGSYSGAPPNEKITWGKLTALTPRFMIESDATICFPLIASYVLSE